MFEIANILTFLAALANLLLGFFVYLGGKKKALNVFFAIFSFITAFWVLDNLLFLISPTLFLLKGQFALGAATVTSALIWIIFLTKNYISRIEVLLVSILVLTLFLLPFMDGLIIKDANIISADNFTFTTSSFFSFYSLIQAIVYIYFMILLFKGIKKNKGLKKTQITYVFFGATLFGVIAIIYGLFLLPIYNLTSVGPLDAQSSLFFVGFSAYVILKHRFLDIRLVVARSVAYALLLIILAGGYATLVIGSQALFFNKTDTNSTELLVEIVLAVLMAFTFQPLRRFLTKATDKVFFKENYDEAELLGELSHVFGSTILLENLIRDSLEILLSHMRVAKGGFFLFGGLKSFAYKKGGFESIGNPAQTASLLKNKMSGVLVYDEMADGKLKEWMRENDVSVLMPLSVKNELIGIFVLGEKLSGDVYSGQDIEVLEILAPEASVAINNARLYSESLEFGEKLKVEVKNATTKLRIALKELKKVDKMKDDFISVASHDLRSPIAVIEGYLSMVRSGRTGRIPKAADEFLGKAYKSTQFLVQLTKDLLDTSRIDQGRLQLVLEELNLGDIVQEVVDQLEPRAKEKGLYLRAKIDPKIPKSQADHEKIIQVIANLITNAVKFTFTGGVEVDASLDGKNVLIKVSDTGRGIPKDKMDHLFEKFFRAHEAATDHPEGTGLGLYISRVVVEMHGGKIWVESEEGKGSVFSFAIPLKQN